MLSNSKKPANFAILDTFCDKKSVDPFTNKIKQKYKALSNKITIGDRNYYIFLVTTSTGNYSMALRVSINEDEWENRWEGYLCGTSYIAANQIETLKDDELRKKMANALEFLKVAKLPSDKHKECIEKGKKHKKRLTDRQRALILPDSAIDAVLYALGIKSG